MRIRSFVFLAVLLFPLVGQAESAAALKGTLTDPSGAAIARAEVTAQPLPAGSVIRATTDAEGRFQLSLPAGRYRLRIEHPSFTRLERELVLAAGESRSWDAQAQLERLAATVIVSAQAEPAGAEAVSSPVTVLTRADIVERQAVWLGPLLATTPGFAISRLGRDGGLTTLFLNGGNSNFTKVLVDGATLNEPGGLVDFSGFALEGVEKIEVVRGAESALHGSDAMAGVVQIFSHRGATRRPALDLGAEGGRFGTARGTARLSGLLGRFDYSAGAAQFYTDGQGPNDHFRSTTLAGNFGWRFTDSNAVRLAVRSNTSDAGVPGQTSLAPPDRTEHSAQRNFTAGLAWDFSTGARWRHRLAAAETYIRQLFDDPASDFCSSAPPFVCDFPFTLRNQFNRAGFTGSPATSCRAAASLSATRRKWKTASSEAPTGAATTRPAIWKRATCSGRA
jgi:outer membrane receptor protein involved in Fe transport